MSITEGALKAVSDERNQAVTQLGVAFVSLENVKCEKEKVENLRIESEERVEKFCLENERLRAEVTEVSKRLDRLKERYRSKAQVTNTVGHHLNEYLFGNKAIDAPSSRPSGEKKSDKPANGQGSESQAKAGISSSYKSGVSKKPSLDEFMEEFPTVEELRNYDEDTGIIDLPKRALFPRTYQLQAVKQQEAREREARKREAREQEHTRSTNITMPDVSASGTLWTDKLIPLTSPRQAQSPIFVPDLRKNTLPTPEAPSSVHELPAGTALCRNARNARQSAVHFAKRSDSPRSRKWEAQKRSLLLTKHKPNMSPKQASRLAINGVIQIQQANALKWMTTIFRKKTSVKSTTQSLLTSRNRHGPPTANSPSQS